MQNDMPNGSVTWLSQMAGGRNMATISDRIEIPAPQAGEGFFSNENQHVENHDASNLNGDSGACSGYSAGQSAGHLADGRRSHFHQLRRDVARLEGKKFSFVP